MHICYWVSFQSTLVGSLSESSWIQLEKNHMFVKELAYLWLCLQGLSSLCSVHSGSHFTEPSYFLAQFLPCLITFPGPSAQTSCFTGRDGKECFPQGLSMSILDPRPKARGYHIFWHYSLRQQGFFISCLIIYLISLAMPLLTDKIYCRNCARNLVEKLLILLYYYSLCVSSIL